MPLASCKLLRKVLHLLIMTEGKTLPNPWHLAVAESPFRKRPLAGHLDGRMETVLLLPGFAPRASRGASLPGAPQVLSWGREASAKGEFIERSISRQAREPPGGIQRPETEFPLPSQVLGCISCAEKPQLAQAEATQPERPAGVPLLSASSGWQHPSARTRAPTGKQGQGCPISWGGEHKDRSKFSKGQRSPKTDGLSRATSPLQSARQPLPVWGPSS